MVSSTTMKNLITKRRNKFVINMCCHVRRNNRDLIKNIVTGFRLL